jgi:hypothetical protein
MVTEFMLRTAFPNMNVVDSLTLSSLTLTTNDPSSFIRLRTEGLGLRLRLLFHSPLFTFCFWLYGFIILT